MGCFYCLDRSLCNREGNLIILCTSRYSHPSVVPEIGFVADDDGGELVSVLHSQNLRKEQGLISFQDNHLLGLLDIASRMTYYTLNVLFLHTCL